jgi:hypothetical protein
MRRLSRALLITGIASVIGGFMSCNHQVLPPEAQQPGWDGEGNVLGFGYQYAGIYLIAVGAICCAVSYFLRGKSRNGSQMR